MKKLKKFLKENIHIIVFFALIGVVLGGATYFYYEVMSPALRDFINIR